MDKYEFNIKVEQIKKLVSKGDHETAMKIADTIDWKRVRSTSLLSVIAQVYERNEEYQEAKDILLLAFERAPIGKRLLFKLTELALKEKNIDEAEAYYREFCELASDDPRQYLLRYMILEAKGATIEQLITSLERYTIEELDEKWLYKLAELCLEAGRKPECVELCDKIMLLFGLGKYVDKAMELKLQIAPLTSYQMDLVENRDKYEAKLKAVEQGLDKDVRSYQDENEEDAEDDYFDSPDEIMEDTRSADDELVARFHEAEVEKSLAHEMSRLSIEDAEDEPMEENHMDETRVLGNIRDIKDYRMSDRRETAYEEVSYGDMPQEELPYKDTLYGDSEYAAAETSATMADEPYKNQGYEENEPIVEDWDLDLEDNAANHLMIEADSPEAGLALALESLKKIHRELGTRHPVAKITGEKLNKRGIFAVADKLAGKDLVIEYAADLSEAVLDELNELMERDATGIIVVLIDTPARIEYLHNYHSGLSGKFQCIGCEGGSADAAPGTVPQRDAAEQGGMRQQEETEQQMRVQRQQELEQQIELKRQQELEMQLEMQRQLELEQQLEKQRQSELAQPRPNRERQPEKLEKSKKQEKPTAAEAFGGTAGTMDVEEFAQYACKYASEIDCSITGKSLLALYERVEMMEEDEVALTKEAAEDLIEEAADKAEKPSFGGRIKGLFSAKYDKEGLLILKEQHFFD